MKHKLLGTMIGTIVALAVTITAFADPCPPEPVCPEGQITVTPAILVPGTMHTEHQHGIWFWGFWYPITGWQTGACHPWHGYSCRSRTVGTPEYWIPPVCRDPIAGCTDPLATNYNQVAEVDDGTCIYAEPLVQAFADCSGWSYAATDPNATSITLIGGSDGGAWLVGWETETNAGHEAVYRFEYEGGDPVEVAGATILESESCYNCPLTPLYHMFVLRDFDAPEGYLQSWTCYVISNTFPSVIRQASICTHPYCGTGWMFRTDETLYAGYVYRDCYGHIVYGWEPWEDSWLRTDFTLAGRDPDSPRLPCCEGTGMGDLIAPSD
jgi:hypothetical protein